MKPENGFPEGQPAIPFPEEFFSDLLPRVQNLFSLKILLYAVWINQTSEQPFPIIDPELLQTEYFQSQEKDFRTGLDQVISNGWLLQGTVEIMGEQRRLCFLNDSRGRAAIDAINNGNFRPNQSEIESLPSQFSRPNIYKLYEGNIGVITPIVADSLKDLEATYSPEWVQEAIQTAVKNNARSLRYIEVVLKNWQEEGKNVGTDQRRRRKTQEEYDPEGYTDGEFSDFIDS